IYNIFEAFKVFMRFSRRNDNSICTFEKRTIQIMNTVVGNQDQLPSGCQVVQKVSVFAVVIIDGASGKNDLMRHRAQSSGNFTEVNGVYKPTSFIYRCTELSPADVCTFALLFSTHEQERKGFGSYEWRYR